MNPPASASDREQLLLRPPPDLPEQEQHGGPAMTALPMLGSLGSMAVMLSFSSTSGGPGGRARLLLAGGVFLLTTIILLAYQLDRAARMRRNRIHLSRASYFVYLNEVRTTIREHADLQRSRNPEPGSVRIGTATQPLDLEIVHAPGGPRADPAASLAVERLVKVQSSQPDLPINIDLDVERWISIAGDDRARRVARAIVCGAVAQQPDAVRVVVAVAPERRGDWEWLKWLPDAAALHAPGNYSTLEVLAPPWRILLLIDGAPTPPDDLPSQVTVIHVQGPPQGRSIDCASTDRSERLHEMTAAVAEATARRIAAQRRGPSTASDIDLGLLDLLDLPTPDRLDPQQAWTRSSEARRLRTPLGVGGTAEALELDLKEAADGGMGPHGLVVGATGSGKSELLRTLVLGLALTHDPASLNLVLVDFKGGATFAGFVDLPHVSALVTNLAEETTLVERMQDALEGEVTRRQQVLRVAGDFASIREYDAARKAGCHVDGRPLPPLPALLIVIDEFTELLTARPEFLDVFVSIGRVGRSLGMHLLLASQRLEEGRLRGLEAHLSFRIALRTFSESESLAAIGVSDAAHLPASPGAGLLRTDPLTLQRFTAAYVSGPPPRLGTRRGRIEPVLLKTLPGLDKLDQHASSEAAPSLREVVVSSLAGHGTPAHRIWLPPLGPPVGLWQLFPDLNQDTTLGLSSPSWRERGRLIMPLGVVDRPRDQRREILTADLRGARGHFIAVGRARSGKSTLLQTFVLSTAIVNTPAETRFFIIDASGGLAVLAGLPHVAGIAGPADADLVRRIVDEVGSLVEQRVGKNPTDAIYLVIDGWDRLNVLHLDLHTSLHDLGVRGLAVNVHLVVSTSRWGEMRIATRELFGTRVELRQGDPLDSEIDRRVSASVPDSHPGRGIIAGPWHVLAALPHLAVGDDVAASVRRIANAWFGPRATPLPVLPGRVALPNLADSNLPRVGIRERDLGTVHWDAERDQHLLVFGDEGSGKTNLLRTMGHEITRTHRPTSAQLVVVSYRGSLLGEFGDDHLLHFLNTPDRARDQIADLAKHLQHRLPSAGISAETLRSRSWWTGPDVFVLVDDHDLVGGADSPLGPLLPLLFQARDVGLHLLLTRRATGGSRALYEPMIQALRDLAAPGVLLSGNPDEGPLLGSVRAIQCQPGRARWVTRETVEVCQIAWTEPTP